MLATVDIKILGTKMTKGHEGPMGPLEVTSGPLLEAHIEILIKIETPSLHQGVLQIIQNPFRAEGGETYSLRVEGMEPLDVVTILDSNLIQSQIAAIIANKTCLEDACSTQKEVTIGANH